jgi:microcystin-dependent protein
MHIGSNGVDNYVIGQLGGVEAVTLNLSQIPNHSHEVQATQSQASSVNFAGNYPALAARKVYGPAGTNTLAGSAIGSAGGSLPHDNRQPYLGINYVISLYGIFPSQN